MKWAIDFNDINDISVEENILLHAYHIHNALDKLKELIIESRFYAIKQEYSWVFTWKDTFKETDMVGIEEHLKKVCKHHLKTYGFDYKYSWLIDFEDIFYDRLVKRSFPYLAKREEIKNTKTAIEEI